MGHVSPVVRAPILAIAILVLLLGLCRPGVDAKLIRATVVLRVPPYGPFTRINEEDEATQPLRKLSGEETLWAVRYGKKLRELYVRAAKVIPPRYDDDAFDLISTDSVRATQAAQALGIGLFDRGGDRTFFELPPAHHLQGNAAAVLDACASSSQEEQPNPNTSRDRTAFWSDFQRFFHVRPDHRYSSVEPESWVFESAFETLRSGSAAYRDEALLSRSKLLGAASVGAREPRPSRLAEEIFHAHLARESESLPPLRVYVLDSNEAVQDLLSAAVPPHDRHVSSFPLPRVLCFELHDESEVDASSNTRFIRILNDFVPITCSEAGEFFCDLDKYVGQPARVLISNSDWREKCQLPSLFMIPAPTLSGADLARQRAEIGQRDGSNQGQDKPDGSDPALSSTGGDDDAQVITTQPTCSPSDDSSEEEFIHGFLWGLALVTTVIACRCSPRRARVPVDFQEDEQDLEQQQQHLQQSGSEGTEANRRWSVDEDAPKSPLRTPSAPPIGTIGGSADKAVLALASRAIAHIPRPKPSSSVGASTSNSPLLGPVKKFED